jgi:hypothetical protein
MLVEQERLRGPKDGYFVAPAKSGESYAGYVNQAVLCYVARSGGPCEGAAGQRDPRNSLSVIDARGIRELKFVL